MGCCSSKLVDEPVAEVPSKGEAQQETQPKAEIQGETPSKPVDEPVAKTPSKGEAQQETRQETRQETQPKGETQGETPPKRKRARDTAILLLTFAGIISEASDLLKPMKAVSEFIKKILEVTKVSFNLPETFLFTKSQRAWRR